MGLRKPHSKGEGPPVFSLEFFIQNHADIVCCLCILVFIGLIPEVTKHFAASIIFVQYNRTVIPEEPEKNEASSRVDTKPLPETFYYHGWNDGINVVFYALVWIAIHAFVLEYIWERTVKRLHLSKIKTSKYYDSGWSVIFYLLSLVWGIDYIIKENYLMDWTMLWKDYPHDDMRLSLKFFMLNQLAFWLHCYPELIFMKIRKEDIYSKLVLYTSSFLMIAVAYCMMLQRLAVLLLVLHYLAEFLFHASRLLKYHGKEVAVIGFKLWMVLFVVVRIMTVFFSVLTLWFGLGKVHASLAAQPPIPSDEEELISTKIDPTHWTYRVVGLSVLLLLQLWVGWTFLSYQLSRGNSEKTSAPPTVSPATSGKGNHRKNATKTGDKAKTL